MPWNVLLGLAILWLAAGAQAAQLSEAEATAKRYADALNRFDVKAMSEECHLELLQYCHSMVVQIVKATQNPQERAALLATFGVADLEKLQKLSPKAATIRLFELAFATVPKGAKDDVFEAKTTIVGSLKEQDLVHVL